VDPRRRIGSTDQQIVRHRPVDSHELEVVIVVGKAKSCCFCLSAPLVEQRREFLPVVQRLASVFGEVRERYPFVPDRFGIRERLGGILLQDLDPDVGRRRGEVVLVQQRTDLGRSLAEVSGEFDFLVSDLVNLMEGAGEIRLHQVADRVELEPDFLQFSSLSEENFSGVSALVCDSEGGDSEGREEVTAAM